MVQEYKTIKFLLDGKQSLTVPVEIKKNGRYITEDVDIIVKGFLKFDDIGSPDTTLYESEEYQKESANKLNDKTIIHPVVFVSDRITISNGCGFFTLMPRSEDVLEDTKTIQERIKSNITNNQIISGLGISPDEQITSPGKNSSTITIVTGQIRTPYKISIQITVIPQEQGGIYGQTVDRGTSPQIDNQTENSTLFSKYKKRMSSNLIIECYGKDDWIPTIDTIIGDNSGEYGDVRDSLLDLSYNTPFGVSTLYDAIISGCDIMEDNDVNDLRKIIYVLTDNESAISLASVDDAIVKVNNIDGDKKIPVMVANMAITDPPTLSAKANTTDTRDINKLSFETGGQALTVSSSTNIDDIVGIFYTESVGSMGYGTYEFVKDMGEEVFINNITAYFDIPLSNSSASWRIEKSLDGYNFTSLSSSYIVNETIDFTDLFARYIKFKIILITGFTNDINPSGIYPDSPALTSIVIIYNGSKVGYLYLNKEEDEVVPYQMVVAVDANEVEGNTIEVGVANSDSINWQDYFSDSRPIISQNGKIVIPIRFSQDIDEFKQEPLHKIDRFTLKAEYGSWDIESTFILYDKDDNIIPSNSYQIYPREGIIILSVPVDSDYTEGDYKIGILNNSNYKLGLKLTNKSSTESIQIYGIGYLYTTGKDLLPPLTKALPEANNVEISNEAPNRYSVMEVSYTYYDSNFDEEDTGQTKIVWHINGSPVSYLNNMRRWNDITNPLDPFYTNSSLEYPDTEELSGDTLETWIKKQDISLLKAGDKVYYEIEVNDGAFFGVKKKSNVVTIIESVPFMTQIFVKAKDSSGNIIDRLASDTIAVIYPSLDDSFYADNNINRSEIIWYVNNQVFKRGFYGETFPDGSKIEEIKINEIGKEEYVDYGLRIKNTVSVQVTPRTSTMVGDPVISEEMIVQNSLPKVYDVAFLNTNYSKISSLELRWSFYDFEILALGDGSSQQDNTSVSWYRKNPGDSSFTEIYIYNDQNNSLKTTYADTFYSGKIITNLTDHTSTVLPSALSAGQQWYAKVVPNDSIDNGVVAITKIVTITS